MISIENKIVDTLANTLPDVYVTTSYRIVEKDFPALLVRYTYAGDYRRSFDNQLTPHHAEITVQLDSYSLDRAEAKQMNAAAVDAMHQMKFICTESRDLSGYYNDLFRVTSRFTAIVEEAKDVDGNTVYQIYRK